MSELPQGWETVNLGKVAEFEMGQAPPGAFCNKEGNGTVFVKAGEFGIDHPQVREWTTQPLKFAHRGDVLICVVGATSGKLNLGIDCAIGRSVAAIRPSVAASQKIIYRQLQLQVAQLRADSSGTAQGVISKQMLADIQLVLPPVSEQTRIANQLDTLLARVQACNDRFDAIPALLNRFRQTVLDAATTGQLTYDWRIEKLGKVTAEEVVAARLAVAGARPTKAASEFFASHPPSTPLRGTLPGTWLLTHIGMVGAVSNGSTPSRQEPLYWGSGIPWVSSGEVANGVIRRTREQITDAGFNNSSVRLLPRGTVLMAMIGEGKTRGQSAILDIDACINQNIAGVVPIGGILDSKYLWFWFRREYENTRTKGNGSGPKALNCERVRELEINLPPLAEQAEIVHRVEALFTLADRIEARCSAARAQAQRLTPLVLAKAFRGELVPQDPNDEPASALLARITEQRATPAEKSQTKKPRQSRTPRATKEATAMTKSRQDENVKDKPYLADHLRRLGAATTAEELFKASELPVADFYKQLAWEVAQGHIADGGTTLEACHAAG